MRCPFQQRNHVPEYGNGSTSPSRGSPGVDAWLIPGRWATVAQAYGYIVLSGWSSWRSTLQPVADLRLMVLVELPSLKPSEQNQPPFIRDRQFSISKQNAKLPLFHRGTGPRLVRGNVPFPVNFHGVWKLWNRVRSKRISPPLCHDATEAVLEQVFSETAPVKYFNHPPPLHRS